MADDVDMDAPQISTLREETTPEPNPTKSKFRVKLVVHEKAEGSRAGSTTTKHGRAESDEDDDDDVLMVDTQPEATGDDVNMTDWRAQGTDQQTLEESEATIAGYPPPPPPPPAPPPLGGLPPAGCWACAGCCCCC